MIDVLKTVNKTPDSKKSASQQNNCECKTHAVKLPNYLIISSAVIYTPARSGQEHVAPSSAFDGQEGRFMALITLRTPLSLGMPAGGWWGAQP